MRAWKIAGCVFVIAAMSMPGCGGSDDEDALSTGTGGKKDSGTDGKAGTGGNKDAATDGAGGTKDASTDGAGGSQSDATAETSAGGTAGAAAGAGGGGTGGAAGTGGGADAGCKKACDCDNDNHNAKGACGGDDCDDNDPDVFTGQTKYFDKPALNGGYDYDCSGAEEAKDTTTLNCLLLCAGPNSPGWVGASPACGQPGQWGYCPAGLACTAQVTDANKKQSCR